LMYALLPRIRNGVKYAIAVKAAIRRTTTRRLAFCSSWANVLSDLLETAGTGLSHEVRMWIGITLSQGQPRLQWEQMTANTKVSPSVIVRYSDRSGLIARSQIKSRSPDHLSE